MSTNVCSTSVVSFNSSKIMLSILARTSEITETSFNTCLTVLSMPIYELRVFGFSVAILSNRSDGRSTRALREPFTDIVIQICNRIYCYRSITKEEGEQELQDPRFLQKVYVDQVYLRKTSENGKPLFEL